MNQLVHEYGQAVILPTVEFTIIGPFQLYPD
jgi:hypothetical protein